MSGQTSASEEPASEPALNVRIPPDARFGRSVRHEVLSFAGNFELSHDELEEFILAIGEALANAIEHSQTGAGINVRCTVDDDKIVAMISDSGTGFRPNTIPSVSLPSLESERGRGLPIMRRYTDIFALHSLRDRGTAVVLVRYLGRTPRTEENEAAS